MARSARPTLRVNRLEDRAAPAAFVAVLGGASLGEGKAVAADPQGNALFAGTITRDSESPAVLVARLGADGEPIWSKSLAADAPWTEVRGVAADATGNVYVTGLFLGTGDFDPGPGKANLTAPPRKWDGDVNIQIETVNSFVVKLDATGNFLWAKSLGSGGVAEASGIGVDAGGNVVVVGKFMGKPDLDPGPGIATLDSLGDPDAFVLKLDGNGNRTWSIAFGGSQFSTATDVAVTPDGTAYVGGSYTGGLRFSDQITATAPGTLSAYVARVDGDGSVAWAKAFGGPGTADVATVAVDGAGAIYAAGTFTETADFDSGPAENLLDAARNAASAFVASLNPAGGVNWARAFGGSEAGGIAVADAAGDVRGVYVTGDFRGTSDFDPGTSTFSLTADHVDLYLSRLNADGVFQGAIALGGPGVDRGEAIARTGSDIYAAGSVAGSITFETTEGARTIESGETPDAFLARLALPAAKTNQAPTVNVDGTFALTEGDDLALSVNATDRENDRLTVSWDVNGDGDFHDAIGLSATVSWDRLRRLGITDNGPARPMAVRVSDGTNPPVDVAVTLLVENAAPRALFRGGPTVREGSAGFVSFAGQTDWAIADRAAGFRYSYDFDNNGTWDLGDGKSYAGGVASDRVSVPANVLADSGPHAVRARIFDKDGAFAEYRANVLVMNVAPRGRLRTDGPVAEGRPGLVRFSDVMEPSVSDRRAGLRYSYDFNGDGVFEIGNGTTYAGSVTAAQYRIPAAFLSDGTRSLVIRARVFDVDGAYTEATVPVDIRNVAPTARLRTVGKAVAGKPVTIAFGGQSDASAADRAAGFQFRFDLDNDGSFEMSGRSATATHTFLRSGTHTIRGEIADKDGGASVIALTFPVDPIDTVKLLVGG